MHELLSLDQRVRRARRRLGEIAAWRVRETLPIGGWSFDARPIGLGQAWPERLGVHELISGPFEVPAGWPLDQARLALDVGGESLLTIAYDGGAWLQLGLDVNHNEFPLDARRGRLEVEAVARAPLRPGDRRPAPAPRRAALGGDRSDRPGPHPGAGHRPGRRPWRT